MRNVARMGDEWKGRGLGSSGESLGNGRTPRTETDGVTRVGLVVLGAVNNLVWEGEEGGRLKETR